MLIFSYRMFIFMVIFWQTKTDLSMRTLRINSYSHFLPLSLRLLLVDQLLS